MSYENTARKYKVKDEAKRLIRGGYAPWDAIDEAGRLIRDKCRHPKPHQPLTGRTQTDGTL